MPLYNIDGNLVLYVHVPKAGGTTIEFALEPYCVGLLDRKFKGQFFPCSPQHFHGAILASLLDLSRLHHAFMTVRHPVARLISEYKWRRKYFGVHANFNEWAEESLTKLAKAPASLDNHLRPMVDFMLPDIEWHRLEDGLEAVYRRLAVFPNLKLAPRRDKEMTSDKDAAPISPGSNVIEMVHRIYAKDFQTFGYEL